MYRICSNRERPRLEAALKYWPQLKRHVKNLGRPRIEAAITAKLLATPTSHALMLPRQLALFQDSLSLVLSGTRMTIPGARESGIIPPTSCHISLLNSH